MMIAWKKLCRTLSAFRVARGGNVAITFAIAVLPILGFVGAAVDYSRANSVKAAMQTALDATALMLAKEAAIDTQDQLRQNGLKYFTSLFLKPEATNIQVTVTYTNNAGSEIAIGATAQMPADFTKILGYDTFNLTASSTAKWGTNRLRVALVLDNTGSMADDGKMPALQTATQGLLTQLQSAVTNAGDVYVSIIPFVKDVNVGAGSYNTDWIYWGTTTGANPQDPTATDNLSWDANNGQCKDTSNNNSSYKPRSTCLTHGTCSNNTYSSSQSNCTSHGVCSVGGNTSQSTCNSNGTCTVAGQTTQSGCTSSGTCSNTNYTSQSACQNAGTCNISGKTSQSSCQSARHCSVGTWSTQTQCQSHGGSWVAGVWTSTPFTWTAGVWTPATFAAYTWTAYTWNPAPHSSWNGCVMDRGYPDSPSSILVGGVAESGPDTTYNFDTTSDSPDPVTPRWSSLYAAEQYGSCPQAVKPLSYDWTGMSSLVNNMSPAGNTNQAIGLQLGWMSLVGGGPFPTPPAFDPLYQYTQVIILLTDGLNTQDRWYTDQNSIDAREALTCSNIKAAGVVLYTIQVNTGGDPTSTLLQNCASGSDKFYLLTTAGQISTTFNEIGTNLTKLRVAQ
jgi:Flp pilus assembly protein TadG